MTKLMPRSTTTITKTGKRMLTPTTVIRTTGKQMSTSTTGIWTTPKRMATSNTTIMTTNKRMASSSTTVRSTSATTSTIMPTTTIRSTLSSGTVTRVTKRIIPIPSETVTGDITDEITKNNAKVITPTPPAPDYTKIIMISVITVSLCLILCFVLIFGFYKRKLCRQPNVNISLEMEEINDDNDQISIESLELPLFDRSAMDLRQRRSHSRSPEKEQINYHVSHQKGMNKYEHLFFFENGLIMFLH